MKKDINISKYDFHDGSLIDIVYTNNNLVFSMESAQIDLDDLKDNITLSSHNTLKGKLHLDNVKEIYEEGKKISNFVKLSPSAEIYRFHINKNKVVFVIIWEENIESPWRDYEILAEKIYWENIPDLLNPSLPDDCWN